MTRKPAFEISRFSVRQTAAVLGNLAENQDVELVEHDPGWTAEFQRLADVFAARLDDLLVSVEHVGSTAVPGLLAKPRLDIDLVIETRDRLVEVSGELESLGYCHLGDRGIPGREAFSRDDSSVPDAGADRRWMPHNLYVCARDSDELARHLAFRDALRADDDLAQRYGALKRRLAHEKGGDRDAYCRGKTEFICDVLGRIAPGLVAGARQNNN
jgi:GrpB-like predicted nucleotidyltransferase (UPF0157 family)